MGESSVLLSSFSLHDLFLSLISTLTMFNNSVVVQLKMSSPKNPYNKQVTPTHKLRLSQGERTSIMKSLAHNIKDMKQLEANPDVIQYLKACNSVGTGYVK